MLEPTFGERDTEPFATGGFSDVYKATSNRSPVVIKSLKVTTRADLGKVLRMKDPMTLQCPTSAQVLPWESTRPELTETSHLDAVLVLPGLRTR